MRIFARMHQRWTIDEINTWYDQLPWLMGCNFIPSTAINQLEMWQAGTFDPDTIDRELGWAAELGMNTVRVFLHDLAWQEDPKGFKQRIDQYLHIADQHGIRTLFVIFDDCWYPDPKPGKQPDPVPGKHNSGWLQSPGIAAATDPAQVARLKAYVQDIVIAYAKDPRILAWDVYNELGNTFLPVMARPGLLKYVRLGYRGFRHLFLPLPTLPLFLKTVQWIREIGPDQPLTAGIWFGNHKLERALIDNSDIVSFHNYFKAPNLERQILKLKGESRPILCTEFMARTADSLFETHLPVFKKQRVGCYNWGLVSGKTQTIFTWSDPPGTTEPVLWFHDILRKDGSPYSQEETNCLRRMRNE